MNRLAPVALKFAKARAMWLLCLACFTAGWLACAAWVAVIHFAPSVALGFIQQVSGVL
jgi:hypothetical protein